MSLLTVAVDQAKQVLNLFPSTAVVSINTNINSNRAATVTGADALATLDRVDFSVKSGVPQLAKYSPASPSSEHVFVLSDFQRSSFQPGMFSRLDSTKQYHLLPLKASGIVNVFVDSVYLEDEFIRPGGETLLHVRVYNAGDEAIQDCPLKLVIDEQQIAALSIDLPANQATDATIGFSFRGTGTKQAYILVEDYPVEFDNAYYFALVPSGKIRLTEVTDDSNSPLQRLYSNEPMFETTRFTAGNIDYSKLGSSDMVVLQGLDEIPSALVSTVADYVQRGGTVVLIPGASSQQSSYAAFLQALSIPASYTAVADNASKTALLAPEQSNPFFKTIFSDYDTKMQMPAAVRSLFWSRSSSDILKFRGGAPYLSKFDRGQGQVYLMAAPLTASQNELVSHALFVPVMYRLAISSYKQESQIAYRLNGSTISIPVAANPGSEGIYKLFKDSAEYIPEQQVRGGRLILNTPTDMGEAGFYDLRLNGKTVATFAFNYDKQESFLEQYSPADLKNFIGAGVENVHVYEYGDAFSVKGEFEKRFFGVKLWKYCLILCLIFLMAEIALIRFL